MSRIGVLFIVIIIVFGCKTDKKQVINKTELITIKENHNFKSVEDILDNPNLHELSIETHAFEPEIVFDGIYVLKTAKDTYSFVLIFDEDQTNFEIYNKWKLAVIATPKDPTQFESEAEQKKGSRTVGVNSTPVMMKDFVVLLIEDFKLKPKEFSFIRFYLYNFDKETNTNYYAVKNATLP